jgi:AcrR family transcriptional regulator
MEMDSPVKGAGKRSYDSSRRQAQARQNQALVAEAARELFVERGYAGTSVRDIAEQAGVAVQTIYNAFAGKAAILTRVFEIAVVGDDEPLALADREEMQAIHATTDPGQVVERWVRLATAIFLRLLPLLPALREAVMADPTIASVWRTNAVENRYAGVRRVADTLATLGVLPSDLDVERATDLLWTYVSFDTAEALIAERGWKPEEYIAWSARAVRALLALEPRRRRASAARKSE